MVTPSPDSLPPPGPTGPGPVIFLILLLVVSSLLWWRVRVQLRRTPREEEGDVA